MFKSAIEEAIFREWIIFTEQKEEALVFIQHIELMNNARIAFPRSVNLSFIDFFFKCIRLASFIVSIFFSHQLLLFLIYFV